MSRDVWIKIQMEIDELRAHLATCQPLLEKVRSVDPESIELMALCALLHGFYTGIENILSLISRSFKEEFADRKETGNWHQQLLANLKISAPNRPALLSEDLYLKLLEYLRFRHVFRHAYQQEIRWNRMKRLTCDINKTLERFILELNKFKSNMQNHA